MSLSLHSTIVPSDSDINDAIPPPQVIIALPAIVPPPMFDSRDFFPPERISPPKDAETPVESPIPISPSSSVRSSSPVRVAQQKRSGPITLRSQDIKMPPKRTSTSAAPAMAQDAIRQLVADSVAAALEAQAANMANTDNTNKNTGTSGTLVARKGTNDHKRNFDDRRNTITNNDNNYPNNRNHNNHPNNHNNNNYSNNRNNNNYQDNHNNHNRNNDYHQQQNRRQETIRTYTAPKLRNKSVGLATRWVIGPGTAEAKDQPREPTCDQYL
ncbi:hypothetical protein Tco_0268673 [Tanacetum coccineum]